MIGNSPLLARAKPSLFLLFLLAPAPTTLFQFPSALFTVGGFFSRATRPAQVKKTIYGREFIEEIIRVFSFSFSVFYIQKLSNFKPKKKTLPISPPPQFSKIWVKK
jgi:hypothetical protein